MWKWAIGIVVLYLIWRRLMPVQPAITVPQTLVAGSGDAFSANSCTIAAGVTEHTPPCSGLAHPPLHIVFPVNPAPITVAAPPPPPPVVRPAPPPTPTAPTYPVWNINQTWNVGDIVRDPSSAQLYLCIQHTSPPAHTLGNDHYWVKYTPPAQQTIVHTIVGGGTPILPAPRTLAPRITSPIRTVNL